MLVDERRAKKLHLAITTTYCSTLKANLPLGGKCHGELNKRDNRNREAENSAAAKGRMDFYFSPRHFRPVEIRIKRCIKTLSSQVLFTRRSDLRLMITIFKPIY